MKLRKDVSLTDTEDGPVLLDQRTGSYWQLNASGGLILRTLLADGTPEQAAAAVVARYPVEPDRALSDVHALVESLRAARLVRP